MLLQQMLSPLGRALKKTIQYLLRDEFTTEEAAPITTPRTCEPGPGSLTIVDTENKINISGGQLNFAVPSTSNWLYQQTRSNVQTRAVGIAAFVNFVILDVAPNLNYFVPLWLCSSTSTAINPGDSSNKHGVYILGSTRNLYFWVSANQVNSGYTALSYATIYQCAILLRSSGAFYLIKGGSFADWTVFGVTKLDSTASLYARANNYRAAFTLDNLSVRQLPAPYDNEASWRTAQLLNPIVGATAIHAANTVVEFTWTFDGATVVDVAFRQTDATHYWRVMAGSLQCHLYERAGGYADRALYSWPTPITVGTVVYIVVIADGNTYRGYCYNAAWGFKYMWTYTDAGNYNINATQTSVVAISGGISEINFFPSRPELPI